MTRLLRNLAVVMMLGIVSVGAFAQKQGQGQDKRPKKEETRVTTNDRKDRPPQNTNQPKPDNKKRP